MKSILICLALIGMGFQFASAQGSGQQRARMQERVEAQRVAFITQKLDLSPDEAAKFWPVYNEFKKVQKAKRSEIKPGKSLDQMNEAEADELIEKILDMEAEMIVLKRDYYEQLNEIIPSTKIVMLVQVETAFNREVLEKLRQRQGQGPGKSNN